MKEVTLGRVSVGLVVTGLFLSPLAGCGSADREPPREPNGGAAQQGGEAGEQTDGGAESTGGTDVAGRGGSAGAVGRAGSGGAGLGGSGVADAGRSSAGADNRSGAGGSGGSESALGGTSHVAGGNSGGTTDCLSGAPCNCGKRVGITTCDESGESSCSCPPAAECTPGETDDPCFEPCGGEPFGAWVLEDTCFAGGQRSAGAACTSIISGELIEADVRLRFLDGGELDLQATERWAVTAQVPLPCVGRSTVERCQDSTYAPGVTLFGSTNAVSCEANDCGFCDCAGETGGTSFQEYFTWRRSGTMLQLGFAEFPYCVQGDEMWVGGEDGNGAPRVAYKFKKRSCTGTPVPCEERDLEACQSSESCKVGACVASTGPNTRCDQAQSQDICEVIQGCEWQSEACTIDREANPLTCTFLNCERESGCSWGEPTARCRGSAMRCPDHPVDACTSAGCAVTRSCHPGVSELGNCAGLSAAECANAPGCTAGTGSAPCVGQARCATQTDPTVCERLGCFAEALCTGKVMECEEASVEECHGVDGCRIEW